MIGRFRSKIIRKTIANTILSVTLINLFMNSLVNKLPQNSEQVRINTRQLKIVTISIPI